MKRLFTLPAKALLRSLYDKDVVENTTSQMNQSYKWRTTK